MTRLLFFKRKRWHHKRPWLPLITAHQPVFDDDLGSAAAITWLNESGIFYHFEWEDGEETRVLLAGSKSRKSILLVELHVYICFVEMEDAAKFRLFFPAFSVASD